jgi:tetratricopeptide (TPR) repeat protein/transcriptional regulator with XRE-family HTH domain
MTAKRQRLVQRRRVVGFSQEALASALRVERSTVVRWESGETEPQPWLRPRLARALRVSLDDLQELLLPGPGEDNPSANHADRPGPGLPPLIDTEPALADAGYGLLSPGTPHAAGPTQGARWAAEAPPVRQLPPAVADFTGREPQLTQLTEMLSRDRDARVGMPVAVVTGLPGAGKTALALQVAHTVRAAFPDGQLWVPLEGAGGRPRDPGEVLGELIRALGVSGSAIPQSVAERASLYRSRLAGRRVLVLADDAASAAQVQPLLPGTGQSAVLVTSRNELAGPPGSQLVPLEPLTPAESVQLLAKIVGRERVSAEPEAAAELAAACGQLPLAVRIAGARLAARTSWQLSALARKITRARRRLDELQTGDMSVRASLTQSYHTLDETGRRAFRRLALLDSAEFTEWQAAALLNVDDATEVLNHLADSSLLAAAGIGPADQARYRPHDLLRDYAAERLGEEPADEQDAALVRVTDGWLQLAARADAGLPREPFFPPPAPVPGPAPINETLAKDITAGPMAWFTTERLALLAVVERCCATGRHQAAEQLASLLASFQYLQTRLDDAERLWRMITTAATRAHDPAVAARAQLRLAAAICSQGRHVQASPLVDQCVTTFDNLGDRRGLAAARYWHAVCESNQGAYSEARHSAQLTMQLAQDTGDRRTEFLALRLLAIAQAKLSDHRKDAVASAEKALALAKLLGEPAVEHEILHTVALVYNLTGRHQDARDLCLQGLALAQDLGVQVAIADWLGISGDAYYALGRHREAAEALLGALPIYRDHFMRRHHALCLLKLGRTYQAIGEYRLAARYLHESLDIFDRLQLAYFAKSAREALLVGQTSQHAT